MLVTSKIWMDQVFTVPNPQKIISEEGEQLVGKVTSGERGQNFSVNCEYGW